MGNKQANSSTTAALQAVATVASVATIATAPATLPRLRMHTAAQSMALRQQLAAAALAAGSLTLAYPVQAGPNTAAQAAAIYGKANASPTNTWRWAMAQAVQGAIAQAGGSCTLASIVRVLAVPNLTNGKPQLVTQANIATCLHAGCVVLGTLPQHVPGNNS